MPLADVPEAVALRPVRRALQEPARLCRAHEVDNLFLADGSVFVSSGGFNPTNTIMSLSLRMAHHIAGARAPGAGSPRHHKRRRPRQHRRHTGRDSSGDRL